MNHRAIMIILLLSVVGVVTVMLVHGCAPTLTGLKHHDGSAGDVSLTPAERKIAWQKMKKSCSMLPEGA